MQPDVSMLRRVPVLLLALALGWPPATAADPVPIVVQIQDYVVSAGKRADYFDGKLLTADDLNDDQEYKRGTDRFISESPLTLDELFSAVGLGSVFLTVDVGIWTARPREPVSVGDPHHDDMIFLDADGGWRGQLYLPEANGLVAGVYDDLSGTFDRFAVVDEPASVALAGLGLLGMWALRRRRPVATARLPM